MNDSYILKYFRHLSYSNILKFFKVFPQFMVREECSGFILYIVCSIFRISHNFKECWLLYWRVVLKTKMWVLDDHTHLARSPIFSTPAPTSHRVDRPASTWMCGFLTHLELWTFMISLSGKLLRPLGKHICSNMQHTVQPWRPKAGNDLKDQIALI